MKILVFTVGFLAISVITCQSQGFGKLQLFDNKLSGKCENKYFTGFEIELDSVYTALDSSALFEQLPRIGTINFRNRINIPTEFTLTERSGYSQIMFRFRNDYLTFDSLSINADDITFTVEHDPIVPVTAEDLKIIKLAKELLSEEKYWHKEDDRNCIDDLANKSFSLYCALRISSLEVENKYNHRNAVLQKLRHLIDEKHPNNKWNHRLIHYNNREETSYQDVIGMLEEIEQSFMHELNLME